MINKLYTTRGNYIFNQIAELCNSYQSSHCSPPIKIGVGDAVLPIAPCVAEAMSSACMAQSHQQTFVGYGSECGLPQYLQAIQHHYLSQGVTLATSEIFASDGAISQLCDILDILDATTIAVPDPSYPVYRDNALLSGKTVIALKADNYLSALPDQKVDAVYLCNPTNPTGMCYSRTQLQQWVDWCNTTNTILIYDSAYSSFVRAPHPTTIYQLEGSTRCAIEICSLSKSASFTGIRCGYTIVPLALNNANQAWRTRLSYKTNGVSYISQIGGTAALSSEGISYTQQCTNYYLSNVSILRKALSDHLGLDCYGGSSSPYLWVQCPIALDSWGLFHLLLDNYGIVTLPGVGMGNCGQGYIRVSGFCLESTARLAYDRLTAHSLIH